MVTKAFLVIYTAFVECSCLAMARYRSHPSLVGHAGLAHLPSLVARLEHVHPRGLRCRLYVYGLGRKPRKVTIGLYPKIKLFFDCSSI